MGRFAVINLTEPAIGRIKDIMAQKNAKGIKVGVKKGGCAGMEYTIELAQDEVPDADVVENNGARVFVAKEAVLFLLGTQMDFETTTLRTGFVFNNPNQTSACGCGESVEIRPASAELLNQARDNL